MKARITLMLFLFSFICNLSILTQDSIYSVDKKLIDQQIKIDSLSNLVSNLEMDIIEYKIDKNWFNTLVSSQWNVFTTILAVILTLIAIFSWKYVLKDPAEKLRLLKEESNSQKLKITTLEKEILSHTDRIALNKVNSHRALYMTHKNKSDHTWAGIFAIRQAEHFVDINDIPGINTWIRRAKEELDHVNISKPTLEHKKSEINRILKKAQDKITDEITIDNVQSLSDKIKSII